MSRRFASRVFYPLAFCCLGLACTRAPFRADDPAADLGLTITLNKAQYAPGEPVLAQVTLVNKAGSLRMVPQLDQASVAFSVQARGKDRLGELKFVEPVRSTKEIPGVEVALTPAGTSSSTLTRPFVFTRLTLERGEFMVAAVYTRSSGSPLKPGLKTYARATALTVAGEKAWAHRYLDGVLAREDAINVAAAKAGGKVQSAEALLITDEAGFQKWWVNLKLEGAGGVRSFFVDPYFARVWKEARPFTEADKGQAPPIAPDAKVLQKLKDQSSSRRSR